MSTLVMVLVSYLIGSVTFGPIIAAVRGVNLRSVGSGNIGATNVMRAVGRRAALATLIGDLLKGTLAVMLGLLFLEGAVPVGMCALAAVLGHNFPVFLGFRGGKGVATTLGALLAYAPLLGVLFVVVWILVFRWRKISSLSALCGLAAVSAAGVLAYPPERPIILLLSLLAVVMHRQNIRRLMEGTEPQMGGSDS